MLFLHDISYNHPNKDVLFSKINLVLNKGEKVSIVGNNGSGKTTLLRIISGELLPFGGKVQTTIQPFRIPQHFGQYNGVTVAQALGIDKKLKALKCILAGDLSEDNYEILNDDWTIEERTQQAMEHWRLKNIDIDGILANLSGGQKTRIFLSGILIHKTDFILMDEPTNHLDTEGRKRLYEFVNTSKTTLLIVSHDRKLLNLLPKTVELNKQGVTVYGGNYDFYREQKQIETDALYHHIKSKEKALKVAKEKEREVNERKQKLDVRGKKNKTIEGVSKMMLNSLKNSAEKGTSKLKNTHSEKKEGIAGDLSQLRTEVADINKMKFKIHDSRLHKGKILCEGTNLNYAYGKEFLWKENLTFQIHSSERIGVNGANGSGKTTLIKIILGKLNAKSGMFYKADFKSVFADQDYSIIQNDLTILKQANIFNDSALEDHEIKTRLHRFLFPKNSWDKKCISLSGGEKMRLLLCCLTIENQTPDLIALDEPTNNLDMRNIEIMTKSLNDYRGTILVISHDAIFLEQIKIERSINL